MTHAEAWALAEATPVQNRWLAGAEQEEIDSKFRRAARRAKLFSGIEPAAPEVAS